jgi:hypothetical protein
MSEPTALSCDIPIPPPPPRLPARLPVRLSAKDRARNAMALSAILTAFGLVLATYWSIECYWRATGVLAVSEISVGRRGPPTLELRMVLNQFLRERTWMGKRQVVLEPGRLDALGRAYYLGRDPDEIRATDFLPVHLPEIRSAAGVHALRAHRPGHRPVVALFKRVGSAWKLDWEMFTQTYDETLPRFVTEPGFAMRTLRTNVSRTFAPAGGAPTGYLIEISDCLDPGQRIELALPAGTPLMQEIAAGLETVRQRPATVEVCWVRLTPDGDCVPALQRLVCWGWRGVTGQPVPAAPAVEAHEFVLPPSAPRAVPSRREREGPVAGSAGSPVAAASGDR